ncbi:MAG: hypothetical protein KF689_04855 [Gemmatimonadaceae bacterium]|nr:hypothetical protein [Gemmatimonadaceae bacterium]MCW5825498.1 hypothetical protein [Gemmatimonadaceae bacterium]
MRFVRPAVLLLATSLTVGCLGIDSPSADRVGLLTLRTHDGGGNDVLRAVGIFYHVPGLSARRVRPQACANFAYAPDPESPVSTSVVTLDAGLAVEFTTKGGGESAIRSATGSFLAYNFPSGASIPLVPNDTVTVSIPGALGGFEPMLFRMPVADSFTAADPALDYVQNEDLTLTWTPPVHEGSVMVIGMRFSNNAASIIPNVELACVFVDNGTGVIPGQTLFNWSQSNPDSRSYSYMRLRDTVVNFDERTYVRLRSQYEVPRPAFPGAP